MLTIIPMNGTGERFKKAGFTIPKPFIPYMGRPILQYAIDSLPDPVLVIARSEYAPYLEKMSGFRWQVLQENTSGPLETLLQGKELLSGNKELLIADCDSFFIFPLELKAALEEFRWHLADGGVTVRNTDDPGCSYAHIKDNWVTATREKDPFTQWSTTGPYWFKDSDLFVKYGKMALKAGITSICPVYNYFIQNGMRIRTYPVKTFVHLGTPEALQSYLSAS